MPSLEIHPLSDLRGQAARLLAERYAAQRLAEPLLPEIRNFHAHVPIEDGLVATRGSDAVAYLAGSRDGDTARVGFAGCAASEPEALRDLFAVLAVSWDVSRFAGAVSASSKELIDVFFRLAFGCQFIWAVRDSSPWMSISMDMDIHGVSIRSSTPNDLEEVARFDEILWQHQTRTPSFSGLEVPTGDHFREEWSNLWNEDEYPVHFVAERRSVNPLSSRFWPHRGFRPQYLRLYRAVP